MVIVLCIIEMLREVIKMIKIRLTYADDEEKDIAIEKIKESFEVLNISREYKGRGNSQYSNVYIDVDVENKVSNINKKVDVMRRFMKDKTNVIIDPDNEYSKLAEIVGGKVVPTDYDNITKFNPLK